MSRRGRSRRWPRCGRARRRATGRAHCRPLAAQAPVEAILPVDLEALPTASRSSVASSRRARGLVIATCWIDGRWIAAGQLEGAPSACGRPARPALPAAGAFRTGCHLQHLQRANQLRVQAATSRGASEEPRQQHSRSHLHPMGQQELDSEAGVPMRAMINAGTGRIGTPATSPTPPRSCSARMRRSSPARTCSSTAA
jgi:hypothetical protein